MAATLFLLLAIISTALLIFAEEDNRSTNGRNVTKSLKDDPQPYSVNNKVVGFVIQPIPSIEHYESLILILDEYLSMCEGDMTKLL